MNHIEHTSGNQNSVLDRVFHLKHTRIGFKSLFYRIDNAFMKPFDHLKEFKCLSNNQNLKMKVAFFVTFWKQNLGRTSKVLG